MSLWKTEFGWSDLKQSLLYCRHGWHDAEASSLRSSNNTSFRTIKFPFLCFMIDRSDQHILMGMSKMKRRGKDVHFEMPAWMTK